MLSAETIITLIAAVLALPASIWTVYIIRRALKRRRRMRHRNRNRHTHRYLRVQPLRAFTTRDGRLCPLGPCWFTHLSRKLYRTSLHVILDTRIKLDSNQQHRFESVEAAINSNLESPWLSVARQENWRGCDQPGHGSTNNLISRLPEWLMQHTRESLPRKSLR